MAASEHEDSEAIEETGRGDRKVGADEAGTAISLRGEHALDQLAHRKMEEEQRDTSAN